MICTEPLSNRHSGLLPGGTGDCDYANNRVRKVTVSTSVITTIAGTGAAGYSGDGNQATAAVIYHPHGINLDSSGNIYFVDLSSYYVVRKVTVSTGIISGIFNYMDTYY